MVTPADTAATPASPFSTTVKHFDVSGSTCSASETVPAGYGEADNCTNVPISNGVPAGCTMTNTKMLPMPNPSAGWRPR